MKQTGLKKVKELFLKHGNTIKVQPYGRAGLKIVKVRVDIKCSVDEVTYYAYLNIDKVQEIFKN